MKQASKLFDLPFRYLSTLCQEPDSMKSEEKENLHSESSLPLLQMFLSIFSCYAKFCSVDDSQLIFSQGLDERIMEVLEVSSNKDSRLGNLVGEESFEIQRLCFDILTYLTKSPTIADIHSHRLLKIINSRFDDYLNILNSEMLNPVLKILAYIASLCDKKALEYLRTKTVFDKMLNIFVTSGIDNKILALKVLGETIHGSHFYDCMLFYSQEERAEKFVEVLLTDMGPNKPTSLNEAGLEIIYGLLQQNDNLTHHIQSVRHFEEVPFRASGKHYQKGGLAEDWEGATVNLAKIIAEMQESEVLEELQSSDDLVVRKLAYMIIKEYLAGDEEEY